MGPRRASSIADLILRRGDIAAASAERSGMIWGNMANQLGQIGSQAFQAHSQKKEEEKQNAAFSQLMQDPRMQGSEFDPEYALRAFTSQFGPEKGFVMARAYGDIRDVSSTKDRDHALKVLPNVVAGLEAAPPQGRVESWPVVQQAYEAAGVPIPERLKGPWNEAMLPEIQALAHGREDGPTPGSAEAFAGMEPGSPEAEAALEQRGAWADAGREPAAVPAPPKPLARIEAESAARARGTASIKTPEGDIDWTTTGEEFLATLKPELQATVQQLGEYRRRPSASLYRSEQGRRLLAMVSQFNPEYDEKLYGEGQKAIGEYTSGATHRNIIAINTLSHHLIPFAEAADALNNKAIPKINDAWNYFRREFGSDIPTNFEGLHTLVSDEIANTFKTTGATDSAIKNAAQIVYSAQSPKQLLGALQRRARLAEGRIKAIGI